MLASEDPAIRRMLGMTPGYGEALGIDEGWAYEVIRRSATTARASSATSVRGRPSGWSAG
jgi:general L-amino acid transport system substrate-binding protein